jgi:hypothetical protein
MGWTFASGMPRVDGAGRPDCAKSAAGSGDPASVAQSAYCRAIASAITAS